MSYKIEILRDQCITAETCVVEAPGTFAIDDEGIAYVLDENGNPNSMILAAAEACPVECIILRTESGQQVWPDD